MYDDFLSAVAWKVSQEAALELAALHTCREFVEKQRLDTDVTHLGMQHASKYVDYLHPNLKNDHLSIKRIFLSFCNAE